MRILLMTVCTAIAPGILCAQNVQLRAVLQDGRVQDLSAGSVIELPAKAVQQEARAQLQLTYLGSKTLTVERADLMGSPDFYLLTSTTGASLLKPNETLKLDARYVAASSARTQAQLVFIFRESESSSTSVRLNLAGTAPEFAVQYVLQTDNNARPIGNGGKISFPATLVEVASSASVYVINQGSGSGSLEGTRITGDSFELRDLPLLPVVIEPGKNARYTVRVIPHQAGSVSGMLSVSTSGSELRFELEASGRLSNFAYQVVSNAREELLVPGGTIPFPNTSTGSRSGLLVRVRNEQNAYLPVSEISTSAPFNVTGVPALPRTLAPGETIDFSVEFNPNQARAFIGRLRIGADQFTLAGTGLGASLSYTFVNSGEIARVDPNGMITFRPAPIGKQSTVAMSIRNEGTSSSVVETIALADARGRFSLSGVPVLPLRIPPGSEVSFQLAFLPAVEGGVTASLVINSDTFSLRGVGLAAPPLPAVQIAIPAGMPEPLQQIPVGLTLSEPYDLDLIGTLNLTSEAVGMSLDPAIQFSTGGRSITFRLPAGSKAAKFANGLETVRVQTGSMAGTIVLSATVATAAKTDLTPAEPPSIRLTIPRTLPKLVQGSVEWAQDNSFTIRIAGIAPGRSLVRLKCQFLPTGRIKLNSDKLEFDLSLLSRVWFQSSQSLEFGGSFGVSVPMHMNLSAVDTKASLKVPDVIQSLLITVEDDLGFSNEVRINLE